VIIALDDVSCTGEEPSLFSCMSTANHDCMHTEDAGVLCSAREYTHLTELTPHAVIQYRPLIAWNAINYF